MPRPLQTFGPQEPAVVWHSRGPKDLIARPRMSLDDAGATGPKFARTYEEGALIVLESGIPSNWTDDDWHLINSIPLHVTDELWLKKAKLQALLTPFEKNKLHVLDHSMPNDRAKAQKVQALIAKTMPVLREQIRRAFPTYKFVGENITWRLTPTVREWVHYDHYGDGDDDLHHVRLFINIDQAPRVWGVGPRIEEVIRVYADRLRPHAKLHPNRFNEKASHELPWDEIARHYVAFAPGNAWLVNSQVVAHEAVFGNRMIACTFDVDPASMEDKDRFFVTRVREAWCQQGQPRCV